MIDRSPNMAKRKRREGGGKGGRAASVCVKEVCGDSVCCVVVFDCK